MDRWLLQSQSSSSSSSSSIEDAAVPLEEMICPLTNQVMMQPVMHRRYGYSCEQSAIDMWFEQQCRAHVGVAPDTTTYSSNLDGKEPGFCYCPLTGLPLQRSDFVPNRALQDYIMDWRQAHLIMVPKESYPAERQATATASNIQERQSTLRETHIVEPENDDPGEVAASSSAVPPNSSRHVVPLLVVDGENSSPSNFSTCVGGDGKTTTTSSSNSPRKRAILAFTNAAGTQSLLLLTNAMAA